MDLTKMLADALASIASSAKGADLTAIGNLAVGLAGILNNLSSAQKNRLESRLRKKDVAKLGALIVAPTPEEIREFGSLYEEIRDRTRPGRGAAKKGAAKKVAAKKAGAKKVAMRKSYAKKSAARKMR